VLKEQMLNRKLYRGDMLDVASLLEPESFRLIYLDPPFLTGRQRIGSKTEYTYDDRWKGKLDAYLPWLETRLKAFAPLLQQGGSMVLHLDWRAAHYAKVMLDEIFGHENFINEIIWHYTGGGRSKTRFSCKHDTLLWYARKQKPYFDIDAVRVPYKETSGYARGGIRAASGRKYLPNPKGTPVDDVWDIPIINPMASERVGYPTQKPKILLQRIIAALSAPGELVGDFCCGSGTTLVCAELMGRRWVGSDQSPKALECTTSRLLDEADLKVKIEKL
jgi:DNA modification methylase